MAVVTDAYADVTASDTALRRFLHGLPAVDQVGAEARAAMLATRSIKTTSKAYALDLAVRYLDVFEEIVAVAEACGDAHLKVILETGKLVTYDNVRRAAWLAMLAGGDFVKTSTGKVSPAATLPVGLVLLEAVRDFAAAGGRRV